MQGEDAELWMELCARAAKEQDHNKLMELVSQINQLLEKKSKRLLEQERDNPS